MIAPKVSEDSSVLEVIDMVRIFDTVDDGETDTSLIRNAGDQCAFNAKEHGGSDDEAVGGDRKDEKEKRNA